MAGVLPCNIYIYYCISNERKRVCERAKERERKEKREWEKEEWYEKNRRKKDK